MYFCVLIIALRIYSYLTYHVCYDLIKPHTANTSCLLLNSSCPLALMNSFIRSTSTVSIVRSTLYPLSLLNAYLCGDPLYPVTYCPAKYTCYCSLHLIHSYIIFHDKDLLFLIIFLTSFFNVIVILIFIFFYNLFYSSILEKYMQCRITIIITRIPCHMCLLLYSLPT